MHLSSSYLGFVFLCVGFMIRQASSMWRQRRLPPPSYQLSAPLVERKCALSSVSCKASELPPIGLVGIRSYNDCGQINVMFTYWPGLHLMPTPEDWRVLSVSHESQGLRMVGVREGILEISSKKKKSQEAVPEEGGLDEPSQRKAADVP